jgi:hypothetical protein
MGVPRGAFASNGAFEYMVEQGAGATFEALKDALGERRLPVLEDSRHLRLSFRLDRPQAGGQVKALCAVLEVGQRLSKVVVVCIDEADGSVVAPDASLSGLFSQVERTLHPARARQAALASPGPIEPEHVLLRRTGDGE